MKKVIKTMMMATAILLLANGCKEETAQPTNNNNGGTPTTPPEQYILMNGIKVKIRNPETGKVTRVNLTSGDSIIVWAGNKPTTLNGDSIVEVTHFEGIKRGSNIVDEASTEYGEVYVRIQYGQTASSTSIGLSSGDYKLEKVDGVWYSVLKNGAGEATKGSTKINLTGIEFRIALPSTFK